jgi:RHS repeat-associated protein
VLGLEIVRHYNSAHSSHTTPTGILGRGWKLSYETDLHAVGNTVQIVQADGSRIIFNRDPRHPDQCSSANPAHGRVLIHKTPRGDEYTWIWTDGSKLSFNYLGKLTQILAPTGEFVSLQHDARGLLVKVTDPQGRSLHLTYPDKQTAQAGDRFRGVQAIDSPLGRFTYHYGSELPKDATLDNIHVLANLVKVTYPTHYDSRQKRHPYTERGITTSSVARIYHYEHAIRPTLLTGITISGAGSDGRMLHQRIATYDYDIDGRAVLSTQADDVNRVTLDYSHPRKTILTNSLGQVTTYRHAIVGGEYRLLEVRGPGCASCGETNVQYAYDDHGRLTGTVRLNDRGEPIQRIDMALDRYGRTMTISRVGYRNGKPGSLQTVTRHEYAAHRQGELPSYQPVLIARPSVVPGKEHRIRFAYNNLGQVIRLTESGWRPAPGSGAPEPIERTTSYRYSAISGRSLLTAIDGPLPNGPQDGPADSDVAHLGWDARGNAIDTLTLPGNITSRIEYDDTGRIARVVNDEGQATAFTYNAASQPTAIASGGVTRRMQYDALGHLVETGAGEGKDYRGLARFGFDGAGRPVWSASHLGILAQTAFDTEGKPTERIDLAGGIVQRQRYDYDEQGRITGIADASGRTLHIRWNEQGLPETVIDALGRERHYRHDSFGRVVRIIQAANTLQARLHSTAIGIGRDAQGRTQAVIAPNGAVTRYIRDDFGRTLATISPDSGTITRSHDAADRLIAGTDANGNRARYEYDAIGRIVRQTIVEARPADPSKKETATVWRYEDKRLIAVEHPEQTERYIHNDQGQLTGKTVTLTLADGSKATSATRYRYDARGQLAAASLPDGSTLHYSRNEQGRIVAMERSRIRTAWLRWLLPAQTIIRDIERDLIGLRHYTYGNGIEAAYQRSRAGLLARIVYRHPHARPRAGPTSAAMDALLGMRPVHAGAPEQKRIAHAAQQIEKTAAPGLAATPPLPGALGLPKDHQALIDHRYLWDAQGNLLHTRSQDRTYSYAYDGQDQLIGVAAVAQGEQPAAAHARYFYDGAGNRLLAQEDIADQTDLETGTVKASYAHASNRWQATRHQDASNQAHYDATGQPVHIGQREYVWDALGKLVAVRDGNRLLARYRYNHRGERIAKHAPGQHTYYLYEGRKPIAELDRNGKLVRQYLYLAGQPITVIDTPTGRALHGREPAFLSRIAADLATIAAAWFGNDEGIGYLHNNHLGATELVTDAAGRPLWQGHYSAWGKIRQVSTGFVFRLRLPGQYEDEETGLYYNDHRYYDPAQGRYLSPDPLGLRAGINTYAYVNGNPLKYIDPSGLVLFAFDGTENSDPVLRAGDNVSNVVEFRDIYDDGNYRYITGVGTVDRSDPSRPIKAPILDAGVNWSGPKRIARMVEYFNDEADLFEANHVAMDVDIIGFSRGAPQARDFANRIVANTTMIPGTNTGWYRYTASKANKQRCQLVNFRFMGLWDTVLSTNWSGYAYNLAIPPEFSHVAHAVALNEFRGHTLPLGRANPLSMNSWGAFPLESIMGDAIGANQTRIELGFIGGHSDIGGGFEDNQLSKVALAWMIDQAEQARVKMKPKTFAIVANPVLHDKSDAIRFGSPKPGSQLVDEEPWNESYTLPEGYIPGGGAEDRQVRYRDGRKTVQRQMTGTGMTFADAEQFITYDSARLRSDSITGTVNMDGYRAWLLLNGYSLKRLEIQGS